MKTTVVIADDLFARVQRLARQRKTTFRALVEHGLRVVLAEGRQRARAALPPLVTYGGSGLSPEFKDWNWDTIRDDIYRGRGA